MTGCSDSSCSNPRNTMTNKSIESLTLIPACVFLVKDVLHLIMEKERDKYIFTGEEEDCRFWIYTVVKIEKQRKVPPKIRLLTLSAP